MIYESVHTTCPYCGCGCGIILQVINEKIAGVIPNKSDPVNEGKLCIKGWNAAAFVNHPERLTKPLIKKNGKLEEADWDEAFTLIASKLSGLKEQYGASSLAVLASARCSNEENYLMMKFARAVLGTNNIDHCTRLCHSSTTAGLVHAFGTGAMTNTVTELEDSDCIFMIGSNTLEQHPLIGRRILKAKEKGAKLIVADPRKIPMAKFADVYIQHQPGTDVALLNGIMNVILSEKLEDHDFIEKRTEGFSEFTEVLSTYSPDAAAEIAGIPSDTLIEAAKLFGEAERGSIVYCMGITQHTTGVDNVKSIANLAMLTGNVGRHGTGVYPLRGQINLQGACDVGALPNVFTGYQQVCDLKGEDEEILEKFEKAWGTALNTDAGYTMVEMIDAAFEGKLKGLYILGENPLLSDPDITHVKAALKNLEFLVVQDIFLSETAEIADVVLPASTFAEKDGTFTLTDRRIARLRQGVPPIGDTKPDWQIICELAKNMGGQSFEYSSTSEIFHEIADLTPIYKGISYQRLEQIEPIHWPCPDPEHPGTPILHKDEFMNGKGKFSAVGFLEPAELPDDEYQFSLTTGRIIFQYHTGTASRRSPKLEQEAPEAFIEMHPEDAKKVGVEDDERVRVTSRRGSIELKVRATTGIKRGVVFIPFHYAESPANVLTNFALDPLAKIPEFKVCAVRIDKTE